MTTEVGVQVGVQLDVEVGVTATSTSLLFLCTKAFPTIQVGVGLFGQIVLDELLKNVISR